jgi:hypothetical protein
MSDSASAFLSDLPLRVREIIFLLVCLIVPILDPLVIPLIVCLTVPLIGCLSVLLMGLVRLSRLSVRLYFFLNPSRPGCR